MTLKNAGVAKMVIGVCWTNQIRRLMVLDEMSAPYMVDGDMRM